MMMELEGLDEVRLITLDTIKAQKLKVSKAYNKRVRENAFSEGELVWKARLPLGESDRKYDKWSPIWDGPCVVHQVNPGGVYHLKELNGELHERSINGKYLKKYYPMFSENRVRSRSVNQNEDNIIT